MTFKDRPRCNAAAFRRRSILFIHVGHPRWSGARGRPRVPVTPGGVLPVELIATVTVHGEELTSLPEKSAPLREKKKANKRRSGGIRHRLEKFSLQVDQSSRARFHTSTKRRFASGGKKQNKAKKKIPGAGSFTSNHSSSQ